MATKKIFTNFQFEGNSEILNPRLNPTGTAPASKGPGQAFFDTGTGGTLNLQFAAAGATNDWRAVHTSGVPFSTDQVFTSSVATGTAPFTIASTTKVANLNVDKLNGRTWSESATADTIVSRDDSGRIKVTAPSSSDTSQTLNLYAVNKGYVDNAIQGLDHKSSVRVATIGANIDISGTATDIDHGDTFNGVTLTEGDRVLVKDQTVKAENGIYVVGAANQGVSRAADADTTGSTDISAGSDGGGFLGGGSDAILGWTASSGTPQAVAGNGLSWTHPSNTDWHSLNTSFTAEVGKTYVIKAAFTSNTTGSWNFRATNTANQHSTTYGNVGGSYSNQTVELIVTPNIDGTVYVYFNSQASGAVIELSTFSVLETALTDGAFVFVEEGTALANTAWVLSDASQVGNCLWTQFSGAGQITAGDGLAKNSDILSVDLASGTPLEIDSNKLSMAAIVAGNLADDAVTPAKLQDTGSFTMASLDIFRSGNYNGILKLNSDTDNYVSGIDFFRTRTGGNYVGGSIFLPTDTSSAKANLYIQAQSASVGHGVTGALTTNNGARIRLMGNDGGFIRTESSGFGIFPQSDIDSTIQGTLHISTARYGASLITGDYSDFSVGDEAASTAGKYGFTRYGDNTIAVISEQLVIAYAGSNGHDYGAYRYFRAASPYNAADLVIGRKYKVSIDLKYSGSGTAPQVRLHNGSSYLSSFGTLTLELVTYTTTFEAAHAANAFIAFTALTSGQSIFIDNLTIQEDSLASATGSEFVKADDLVINNGGSQAGLSILGSGGGRIHFGESGHAAQSAIINTYNTTKNSTLKFQACATGGTAADVLSLYGVDKSAMFEGGLGVGALAGAGGQGLTVDKTSDTDWIAKIKNSSTSGGSPYGLQVDCQGSNTVTAFAVYSATNHFKVQTAHSFFSSSLGIGKDAAPSAQLEVHSASSHSAIHITTAGTNKNVDLKLAPTGTGSAYIAYGGSAGNNLDFYSYKTVDSSTLGSVLVLDGGGTQDHKGNSIVNSSTVAGLQDGGSCYNFNGTTDYVQYNEANVFSGLTSGSISAWIKTSVTGTYKYIFSTGDDSSDNYVVGLAINNSDALYFYYATGGSGTSVAGSTNVCDGKWHHIVAISSGTGYSLYIDGVAETVSASGDNGTWFGDVSNRDGFDIGRLRQSTVTAYFNGQIRDFKIFPSVLTEPEVRKLYSGENPKKNLNVDLVTNGDFSSALGTTWVARRSADVSIVSGELKVVNAGGVGSGIAEQAITLTGGKTYKLKADVKSFSGLTQAYMRVWTTSATSGGSADLDKVVTAGDDQEFVFTVSGSGSVTRYVTLQGYGGSNDNYVVFDNVSLTEVETLVDLTPQSASSSTWRNEVSLLYNGTVHNARLSAGYTHHSPTHLVDNDKASFGDGDDLQIYHDGSNSYIKDGGTGNLVLNGSQIWLKNTANNANMIGAVEGSYVKLYDNGSERLATDGAGVKISNKLGIGTLPHASAALHVVGDIRINTTNSLVGQTSGNDGTQLLYWDGTDAYLGRSVSGLGNGTVNSFVFRITDQVGAGTSSDKLVINSAGVGIGDANAPNKDLEVGFTVNNSANINANMGSSGNGVLIENNATNLGSYACLDFRANNADGRIAYTYDDANTGAFHFDTDNANTMAPVFKIGADGTQDHKGNRIVNNQTVSDSWRSSEPSLRFDNTATTNRVDVSGTLDLGYGEFTLVQWLKTEKHPSHSNTNYSIFTSTNASDGRVWIQQTGGNSDTPSVVAYIRNSSGATVGSLTISGKWQHGVWKHLALTCVRSGTGVGMKLYIDGVEVVSNTTDTSAVNIKNTGGGEFRIGNPSATYQYGGEIKYTSVHNRAMDADDVKRLYNSESTPYKYADADPSFFYDDTSYNYYTGGGNHSENVASNILTITASGVSDGSSNAVTINAANVGTFVTGKTYKWQFQAKLGSGTTSATLRARTPFDHSNVTTGSHKDFVLTSDWVTYEIIGTQIAIENAYFGIIAANAFNANVDIRNIKASEAGEIAAYTPQSINDKWYDTTSNANHGAITGATTVGDIDHFGILTVKGRSVAGDDDNNTAGCIKLGHSDDKMARIDYDPHSTSSLRIDNTHDDAAAEIEFGLQTSGTRVIPMQLLGDGTVKARSSASTNLVQVARVHSETITADSTNKIFRIHHNLGTRKVVVQVAIKNAANDYRSIEVAHRAGDWLNAAAGTALMNNGPVSAGGLPTYTTLEFVTPPAADIDVTVMG